MILIMTGYKSDDYVDFFSVLFTKSLEQNPSTWIQFAEHRRLFARLRGFSLAQDISILLT